MKLTVKSTEAIRSAFLEYFASKGHEVVSSSSLVPHNDATLLFTNAGMVQFKDTFLGIESRPYGRATSSQRCVRAGGKHNDLENVGYTARHHTFFEMLGNFSFGDYFKREAIAFAWGFLTEVLALPEQRLWVSIYQDDDETASIWLDEMKIDPERFSRCGAEDNFWSMGETGPCGPCTEIFYDHGPEIAGGPPGSPDQDGDRYVEIWNLVFMQYDRDANGQMQPLPKPSVDTGMGLERIASVLQGVHDNYHIDLFQALIQTVAKLTNTTDLDNRSLRVIADHIRSTSFLMTDGIMPSNEGRGYVLRRIIRRAARHGQKLGAHAPFFHKLVKPLCTQMGEAYPELIKCESVITRQIKQEEEQFARTLSQGISLLEAAIEKLEGKTIPGDIVFQLYDTYGFPVDLTADIAKERDLYIDYDAFQTAMEQQRSQSKNASQFKQSHQLKNPNLTHITAFTGYETLDLNQATILHLFPVEGEGETDSLNQGEEGLVVLDSTPFYAESGGQVGDTGQLQFDDNGYCHVVNTRKQGKTFLHYVQVKNGSLIKGSHVKAVVDQEKRFDTMLNHTATHLLHAALRQLLGNQVAQKGSLVEPDRLRFDFSYSEPLTAEQLIAIEDLVNLKIRENLVAKIEVKSVDEAIEDGAIALFGEKYDDQVRVLKIGEFSCELCGGTHTKQTGAIGLFKITSESGIAAGVRRIEALTGRKALDYVWLLEQRQKTCAKLVGSTTQELTNKLEQLVTDKRKLEKELSHLHQKLSSSLGTGLTSKALTIGGLQVLATRVEGIKPGDMRNLLDDLKQKLERAAIVLALVNGKRVNLVVGVTNNATHLLNAGELVNFVAKQIGGKGGGRADMAQAGGTEPENLDTALSSVVQWVENTLKPSKR